MNQPTLFSEDSVAIEKVILFALGEFQSRDKVLIDRELPLDRLRGAFKRACENYGIEEYSDQEISEELKRLGAEVKKVPDFIAKHPFKVRVHNDLAQNAFEFYKLTILSK